MSTSLDVVSTISSTRLAGDVVLSVRDLVRRYRVPGGAVEAVSNVSLDLRRGETLGIVGESGCGKSSLGRAIMQLPPPTSGAVVLDGVDLTSLHGERLRAVRQRMQMIFQDPIASLNPRRNLVGLVGDGLRHTRLPDSERDERVQQTLALVGLDRPGMAERRPHEFSGGQCQRISIARAMAMQPEVLICDEPVASLDVSIQGQVLNLLTEMREQFGLSMLFISHNLDVVRAISDRIAVMYMGRIVEIGPAETIYHRPTHPYTKALIAAIPHADDVRHDASTVFAGELPSLLSPPTGCRFRTRCTVATERCQTAEPVLMASGADGALVACHHPDRQVAVDLASARASADPLGPAAAQAKPTDMNRDVADRADRPAEEPLAARRAGTAGRARATLSAIGRHLLMLTPVLLLVSLGAAALTEFMPGSPGQTILGETATPENVAALNRELGMDRPFLTRYGEWLGDAVRGDFGTSIIHHTSVLDEVSRRLPVTLEVALGAMFIALLLAVPAAVVSAKNVGGRLDRLFVSLSTAVMATPAFVAAILLIYVVGVRLQWLPVLGWKPISDGIWSNLEYAALPSLTLGLVLQPLFYRVLRSDIVATLKETFILAARSRGFSDAYVLVRHAIRPSLTSLITIVGVTFGQLLAGTVLIESIFSLPGSGSYTVQAMLSKDVPVVQAVVVLIAAAFVAINALIDVAHGIVDPRVKGGR
jgi:peptide/nickel transport system ATP-binding protein